MKTKGLTVVKNPNNKNRKPNGFGKSMNYLAEHGSHYEHLRELGENISVSGNQLSTNVNNALANSGANSLVTPVADFRSPVSAAMFDILIVRDSADLAFVLPVPIFGVLDQESDWTEIMAPFLAAGMTYVVARAADKKSITITYTVGGTSDVVTISCNQVPYVNLLAAGLDSVFRMQQLKLQISDVTNQSQFSQSVRIFDRSFFGYHKDDQFTPNQFKTDLQNQNDIRTINNLIDIDKQRTILFGITAVAQTFTVSAFVQAYNKGMNASSLER
jgi:hypothetical protein